MNDVPNAVLEQDEELNKLLESLETGEESEEEAAEEVEEEVEEVVETVEDDPNDLENQRLKDELEKANQRYSTLQGMMRADQQRTREIISELERKVGEAQRVELEKPLNVGEILTEDELAEFGEAGVATLQKLAGAIAAREIARAKAEVDAKMAELMAKVDQAQASAEGRTIWDSVERINPGSKAINAGDQEWFAFLEETDPISRRTYRELGQAAASVGDVQRLSDLVDFYRKRTGKVKAKPVAKPAPGRPSAQNDGRQQTQKRIWTQDEAKKFYEDVARGTSRMSPEQVAAVEADLEAAMEEGRFKL